MTHVIHYRLATAADANALAQMRWDFRLEETNGVAIHSEAEFLPVCSAFIANGITSGQWAYWVAAADASASATLASASASARLASARLLACICICVITKIPKPNQLHDAFGYVTNVYARPECRNQGVGTQLMTHATDWARAYPLDNLLVYPSERSVPFYERAGFVHEVEALNLELHDYIL